jgi:hypothetical protein
MAVLTPNAPPGKALSRDRLEVFARAISDGISRPIDVHQNLLAIFGENALPDFAADDIPR